MASYRDNNYGFGEIPQNRGSSKKYMSFLFIVVFLVYFCWETTREQPENYSCINITSSNDSLYLIHVFNYMYALIVGIWCVFCGKFIHNVCLFAEESNHVKTRYNGSILEMMKSCFHVFLSWSSLLGILILACSTFVMMKIDKKLFDYHHVKYWPGIITSIGGSLITNNLFGLQKLSPVELSEIHESSKINVAEGLAWSYFTGYLEIILKDLKGVINKSERWKSVSETNQLECKFFAVVPLNCKVTPKLETDNEGITLMGTLPAQKRQIDDSREYINSVYEITHENGNSCFGICGYVITVDTLHKMPFSTELGKNAQEKQCRLFVQKLTELIRKNNLQGKCEIVTLKGRDNDNKNDNDNDNDNNAPLRNVLYDRVSESLKNVADTKSKEKQKKKNKNDNVNESFNVKVPIQGETAV